MTTIHLALVDDWELSGNGSGDVRQLQFEPLRRLVSIYNRLGIHGSFNAEVMQQITFRQHQDQHRELKVLADEWDETVRETFRQGHDIQLHIHPQWQNAEYQDGHWDQVFFPKALALLTESEPTFQLNGGTGPRYFVLCTIS